MKIIDYLLAWTLVALGVVHCVFTLVMHRGFSLGAVWSLGTGVALILAGLINYLRIHSGRVAGLRTVCIVSNLLVLATALMAAYFFVHLLTRNPQVPILLVAIVGELIFSLQGGR